MLGVLALAAVVAAAGRGAPAWAPLREGYGDRWAILIGVLGLAGAVIFAGFVLTLVLNRARSGPGGGSPPVRASLLRAAPITAVAMAILALLAISRVELHPSPAAVESARDQERGRQTGRAWGFLDHRATVVAGSEEDSNPEQHALAPTDPSAIGPLLLLAIGIALLAILSAIAWLRYRHARGEWLSGDENGAPATDDAAAREVLGATIYAMLTDPDPRTAVIGAYARLLEGLAACGGGRHDHEAPLEHFRRVLTLLRVRSEPLRELIELFERARFSTHELTPGHRDRALAALHAVAADLGESAAAHADAPGRAPVVSATEARWADL